MANASVRWVNGKRFIGVDSTNHSVVLSTPEDGVGMKPSDLLLVALASCTAVDVVDILVKKRILLTSLEIVVSGEQDSDPPWTFRKIHLIYRVGGKGLTEKAIEQAIQLSKEKYCSVAATVRGVAEITTSFELLPEA
ncbi:MAG: OsmC family protein [Anaerolineaceae bacterium]